MTNTEDEQDWEWVIDCMVDPPHTHRYPKDWQFGGANGTDPRADPRWVAVNYQYLNARLEVVWTTCTPLCDDQALDEFSRWGPDGAVFIQKKVAGESAYTIMKFKYDFTTDTVYEIEVK